MINPSDLYKRRIDFYSKLAPRILKHMDLVGYIRLIIVVITIISGVYFFRDTSDYISFGIIICNIALFIYAVNFHNKLKNYHKHICILKKINEMSIDRLKGKWTDFSDKGEEFIDEFHSFSKDLDIFGKGSLYQWINSTTTYMGRTKLANILTNPTKEKDEIEKRQKAIRELSKKRWWRQRLQAESMLVLEKNNGRDKSNKDLLKWAVAKNSIYLNPYVKFIIRLLPIITVITFILSINDYIPFKLALLLIIMQFLMLLANAKEFSKQFDLVFKYKNSIKAYEKIIDHFEKGNFKSQYIMSLKDKLRNEVGLIASRQLKNLDKLVERTLYRKNMLFFPINIITLWDYQCMIKLEQWKKQSGLSIKSWLDVIGEIEALSSLAIIDYDNPKWTKPTITDKRSVLNAKHLGHPLLTNKRVCNDINLNDPTKILLITGSNMSGKSTLLRTVGINLVLAYTGSVVCTKYMRCSIMNIKTCMRTNDNLERGISSFYAELQRIKVIIKELKKDKEVFFLLDEIFKGTNSYDRHIGAKMVMKQLLKNKAMGLVSTHDLELGDLEKESKGKIKNYHFQENYKNNSIYFDYKLRKGISKTRNALYLIKMAGIEIDET
ncbi:MAG: DNA mismatch repair protein [Firmicutes bacterium]|nr:DNA mismatch repair protein [Bacillota bacterium]